MCEIWKNAKDGGRPLLFLSARSQPFFGFFLLSGIFMFASLALLVFHFQYHNAATNKRKIGKGIILILKTYLNPFHSYLLITEP